MAKQSLTQQVLYSLEPTSEQADALDETVAQFRLATQYVADYACDQRVFGKYALQRAVYTTLRKDYSLMAQMAILAISQAVDACQDIVGNRDGAASSHIGESTNIIFDRRMMLIKGISGVSLLCLKKREIIDSDPFFVLHGFSIASPRSLGQAELFTCDGNYYLALTTSPLNRGPERVGGIMQNIIEYIEAWPAMADEVRHNVPKLYQMVQPTHPQRVLDTLYAESGSIAPKLRWATADPDKMWPPQAETGHTDFAPSRAASLAQ